MSGHGDGSVAVWDLSEHKLLKHVPDMHESDVTQCRIRHVEGKCNIIHCLSSEDKGCVRMLKLTKRAFFGGYSVESDFLFKERMIGTTSIAAFRMNEDYEF